MQQLSLVDMEKLQSDLDAKANAYRSASPFPHIVLDDVLEPQAFARCVSEFPGIKDEFWKGYLHVNETKYSNTDPDSWGQTLHDVAREFCSPDFVRWLEELTGISGLLPDWSMDGGGLHQTLRGGHLNLHADFTTHHEREDWARRVNILLYLNEEWPDEWGGELRAVGPADAVVPGEGDPRGQPDAGVHHVVRQLPRPPRRPHVPGGRRAPVDGALLLHPGGEPDAALHQLPGASRGRGPRQGSRVGRPDGARAL